MQKNETGPYTKWTQDHIQKWTQNGLITSIRPEAIKFLRENTGSQVLDIGLNTFVNLSPQAR